MDNGIMIYHNCIACRKGWCNKSTAKKRVDWATAKKKKKFDIGITGSLLDSTVAGVLMANYGLFRSLERDIVRNA